MMPMILVVNNDVPAKTVQELAALARAQPGKLVVGHAGVGTPAHLAGELFKSVAEVDVQQVALSRHPGAAAGSARGAHLHGVPQHLGGAATDARRQAARAGGHVAPARGRDARRADHGGSRLPGHRRQRLVRPDGAGRNAAGDRRAAASRNRAHPGAGRRPQAAGRARHGGGGEFARGIRRRSSSPTRRAGRR